MLAIAGSDPMGGAGIQADIQSGLSLGVHVLTAITAVTAQNSKGMKKLGVISPCLLENQLTSILEDVVPNSIKIGMIGSSENLKVIDKFLKKIPQEVPIVIDPVIKTTAGSDNLSEDNLKDLYKTFLFPRVTVVTPNLMEMDFIPADVAKIIKGGHGHEASVYDKLIDKDGKITIHKHQRISCSNTHGSGCCYSSLLACYLAFGLSLKDAFLKTSAKVNEIISRSCEYSLGNSSYGPLNINNYIL